MENIQANALTTQDVAEITFKKKIYKVNPAIGFQKKLDAANTLVGAAVVVNELSGTAYMSADIQAMSALVMISYCTTIKVDFSWPPEKLYGLYDALVAENIIDTVRHITRKTMEDIYDIFKYMFVMIEGESKCTAEDKKYKESFGVYAKDFLSTLLGEGNYGNMIAESTGLVSGLQEVMRGYKAVGREADNKLLGKTSLADNIINLRIKKED